MRSHFLALLASLGLLVALAAPAAAQSEPEIEVITDNLTVIGHDNYQQGTDLFFQRREGAQTLDGVEVEGTRDYLFAGNDASGAVGDAPEGEVLGVRVYDVTDPTAPALLANMDCGGYHADIAVADNYLVQAVDSAGSNTGCAAEWDPDGNDIEGEAGLRIFDITDPANPVVAGFVGDEGFGEEVGVHNVTTLPWAGIAYMATSDLEPDGPRFAWVDLNDPSFPAEVIPMRDISSSASGGCHDIGVDPEGEMAFCAAVEQTHIWDISDPKTPTEISTIVNPAINIHHGARLAPDGTTLVVNDELGGAAAAFGCLGTGSLGGVGALWFYDISDPSSPSLMGSFSTEDLNPPKAPCTSHFYNFIPGQQKVVVGWYKSGLIVVDYEDPMQPQEHAKFLPEGGDFWAAYYYRGFVYGSSFGGGGQYGGADESAGLWILQLDGVGDVAPSVYDQGTVWAPWTAPADEGAPTDDGAPSAEDTDETTSLPSTGGGLGTITVLAVAVAGVVLMRRRSRRDLNGGPASGSSRS